MSLTPQDVSSSRPALQRALLASAVAAAFSSPVWAQEQTLAPVVVSAEQGQAAKSYGSPTATVGGKEPVTLREIAQPVTVVTRERIEDQNMVRLEDLARRSTGMLVLANDQGRSSIFVRGFELDNYLIDGLPSPLSSIYGTQPDLAIFDRVEVLRGPSGLYNGAGEPGGTVNLVRKRALKGLSGSVSQAFGSWNASRTEADLTGSLNESGSIRGRVAGAYQKKDNFIDVNKNENSVAYGTLEFDLAPRTTLSLAVTGANSNVLPFNGLPAMANGDLIDFDRSTFIGAKWNHFQNDSTEAFAELTHALDGGGKLKAAARYVDRSVEFKYAYAASAVNAAGNVSRTAIAREYAERSLATDFSLSQPFSWLGQKQSFTAGVDYRRYDQTLLSGSANIAGTTNVYNPTYDWPEPTIALSSRTNTKPQQYGVYGNLRIKPIQPVTLIGGARSSWYESKTTNLVNGAVTTTKVDNKVTPFAAAIYDLGSNWSTYVSYTGIFQPQVTSLGADGQPISPREGKNYEIGLKGEHFGGQLNSTFSVYRLRDRNRAVAVPGANYSTASGEVEVKGFEAEVSGTLLPNWEASAGYAYTQTEYLAGTSGQAGTTFSTYTPRHNVNLWTRYDFTRGALQGAYLGGGMRAMSSFYNQQGTVRYEQGAYAVFDALAGYRFSPKADVSLSVTNLFDKKYYQRVGSATVFNFYGEPRSIWLKTTLKL
ncbi:MAG: TonB-dependent siderophore receptor [Candidatus Dactylopiibacterium sp.]|nr:TonB-dependent siderophore receptor [Candidatus Dactylopiibacterium sp.]